MIKILLKFALLFLCRKAMIYIIIKSHTAFLLYWFLNGLSVPAILLYIASSLRSYCQLAYTSSLIPKTYIHVGTFLKSGKSLYCLTFIAVNLPTTYTFTVLPCILDKSDHISQWISQKQSDFMRKIFSLGQAASQSLKCICRICTLIPILLYEIRNTRFLQISFKAWEPADINQRLFLTPAKYCEGNAFFSYTFIKTFYAFP